MANNLESKINELVSRAAAEIAAAVRHEIEASAKRDLPARGASAPAAAPKRRGRPPGSKNKPATAAPAAAPAKAPKAPKAAPAAKAPKAPKAKAAKAGRRTSDQVAADDGRILDYVKAHGGQRSEDIQKGLGLPKQDVASGLQRLRDDSKVKMKGVKRGATYTAA